MAVNVLTTIGTHAVANGKRQISIDLVSDVVTTARGATLGCVRANGVPTPVNGHCTTISPCSDFAYGNNGIVVTTNGRGLCRGLYGRILRHPSVVASPQFISVPNHLTGRSTVTRIVRRQVGSLAPGRTTRLILTRNVPTNPVVGVGRVLSSPRIGRHRVFIRVSRPALNGIAIGNYTVGLVSAGPSIHAPTPRLKRGGQSVFRNILNVARRRFGTLRRGRIF